MSIICLNYFLFGDEDMKLFCGKMFSYLEGQSHGLCLMKAYHSCT
jgi:hypothetical protein